MKTKFQSPIEHMNSCNDGSVFSQIEYLVKYKRADLISKKAVEKAINLKHSKAASEMNNEDNTEQQNALFGKLKTANKKSAADKKAQTKTNKSIKNK